ncbi:calcium-translocating P-type ATPase [Anaerobacterium chartisolvens]|uniref:P-type Ca(2+) transporter n=1 Tax=Anaerobacterium chartisolvens TaxID=1297424 RepID=A0A369B8G9_9FIRM|nr:calcium-translocating P-type ATPase, PMCA-type [Anaerobacterium chartisolvens]RCX17605.1 calcium-translocating P-type ATPase [Anaerobacterium chartisolvens]
MKKIGLDDSQVEELRQKFGDNTLGESETESFWEKLKGNFGDPMIKILCVALIINVIFAFLGQTEWYESAGIALAVILATFISTFSEYRNENAFQKLQDQASKIKCKVYRNGDVVEIPIDDVVVDDCILLQTGDKIPADGILLDGSIKVDQSVLNGEAKEASKKVMPDDYVEQGTSTDFLNEYKVFRGTVVCSGNATMAVTTVGKKTVYGQIASELQVQEDRDTPLKVKLSGLAGNISKFGYIGGLAIAVAFLFQRIVIHNGFDLARIVEYCSNWMTVLNNVVEAVILAVIIIVMAVPEGLPLMIAIVSALNMGKMLKDNVLVRKIAGIETAGSINILFSDKTGTITKGKLEAVVFVDGEGREYNDYSKVIGELGKLLSLSVYSNSSAMVVGGSSNTKIIGGNATERAILGFVAGKSNNIKAATIESIPFNSENKYSAAHVHGDYHCTLIKGAPENIISRCTNYFDVDGQKKSFESKKAVEEQIDKLAARAIRVLALATTELELNGEELPEGEWTLVGIIGIRDEVRAESIPAIDEVQNAGVQVVMITGDRKDTAVAIAKEAGLIKKDTDIVLTSEELQEMPDEDLKKKLKDIRVVSRALPSDKSRFVRIAQEMNLVVGMTGDGVNDSPALKKADVGFAMGGGTEVAKEASDIVIMDDNFSSIDKAILYGRTIFNSIRKFIIFQLTINVTAVLISFIAPLLGMENPLSITQILWVNLVMDTLAALAFGGEPALKRFMKERPKRRDENIVSPYMWRSILTVSLWLFAVSLFMLMSPFAASLFREHPGNIYMLTGYFSFFIFASVFNAFNARTEKMNLFDNIGKNKGFIRVIALIVVIQVLMTYLGGAVLRCAGLTAAEWVFTLALALTVIPVDLIKKAVLGVQK